MQFEHLPVFQIGIEYSTVKFQVLRISGVNKNIVFQSFRRLNANLKTIHNVGTYPVAIWLNDW